MREQTREEAERMLASFAVPIHAKDCIRHLLNELDHLEANLRNMNLALQRAVEQRNTAYGFGTNGGQPPWIV